MSNVELIRKVNAAQSIDDFLSIRNWEIPFRVGEVSDEDREIIKKKARQLFGPKGMSAVHAHIDDLK